MSKSANIESLQYPIGKLSVPKEISEEHISKWIDDIAEFPKNIRQLTENLSDEELNWKYRPDGWSIRQVVHHCADSHINSIIRYKLTLTEDVPTIKPYLEDKWAELADTFETPISASLSLLDGLHSRWVVLLRSMSPQDFEKKLFHPEHGRELSLNFMTGLYSWHCRHHTAHIKQALEHKGEFN
jgi:hypothetical protein